MLAPAPDRHEPHPAGRGESRHAVHLELVGAVLAGRGLPGLAQALHELVGAPVAIIVPRLGRGAAPADAIGEEELAELAGWVQGLVGGRTPAAPASVVAEWPVITGTETIGAVALLGPGPAAAGVRDLLTMAAIATLTELAIADARDEADEARQSSLIELIRAHADVPDEELLRRAYRLGSDLSAGAVALCCDLHEDRPRYVADLIHGQQPRALVDHIDRRVYALIPPAPGARDRERVALEAARSLAGVLEPYGTVGFSPYCASLRHLARAIEESELTLEVLLHDGGESSGIDSSTYRLLVRTLAASPEEVRRFYENTVAALVRYDDQYRTDLVGTLDAYLAHNCNMNATAAAIFAHRHTVAYRLERVRELTGLDPAVSEHRERLGLGLKAHRILAPRLVR